MTTVRSLPNVLLLKTKSAPANNRQHAGLRNTASLMKILNELLNGPFE